MATIRRSRRSGRPTICASTSVPADQDGELGIAAHEGARAESHRTHRQSSAEISERARDSRNQSNTIHFVIRCTLQTVGTAGYSLEMAYSYSIHLLRPCSIPIALLGCRSNRRPQVWQSQPWLPLEQWLGRRLTARSCKACSYPYFPSLLCSMRSSFPQVVYFSTYSSADVLRNVGLCTRCT